MKGIPAHGGEGGTRSSIRPLPTHTIQWFYELCLIVPPVAPGAYSYSFTDLIRITPKFHWCKSKNIKPLWEKAKKRKINLTSLILDLCIAIGQNSSCLFAFSKSLAKGIIASRPYKHIPCRKVLPHHFTMPTREGWLLHCHRAQKELKIEKNILMQHKEHNKAQFFLIITVTL